MQRTVIHIAALNHVGILINPVEVAHLLNRKIEFDHTFGTGDLLLRRPTLYRLSYWGLIM